MRSSRRVEHSPVGSEVTSHRFSSALAPGSIVVCGDAVFGENGPELLQRGVRSHPGGVKVCPTHPEAGFRQVLEELVESE